MSEISMRRMLESGVHFGHQTCYWSPKMAPYIYGERNNTHIINLEHSLPMYREALSYLAGVAGGGGVILFVGTKRQAGPIVREHAMRCGMHWVDRRWLGGMLTNHKTIRKSIDRLKEMDARVTDGSVEHLTKNERMRFERERIRLNNSLSGIRDMEGLPDCLFVIDVRHEYIAVQEANKLGIPVVAVVDTNCSPRGIDHVIPGNDDAIRAIRLYLEGVADAIIEARAAARAAEDGAGPGPDASPASSAAAETEAGAAHKAAVAKRKTVTRKIVTRKTAAAAAPAPADAAPAPADAAPAPADAAPASADKKAVQQDSPAGETPAPADSGAAAASAVSAAQVRELRDKTGAGMMDCKKALAEAGGDVEAAVAVLRKKNAASAGRKAGRAAAEGAVVTRVVDDGRRGLLLEVNCETDFVARDGDFRAFLEQLGDLILEHKPAGVEALGALPLGEGHVEDARLALSSKVGENVRIRRFTVLQGDGLQVAEYNHGGRIGVLITLQGDTDAGRDVAMHIAASNPLCVTAEQVPAEVVAKEREIYVAQAAESDKPPAIVEKMVEGRMRKFLDENALLGQPFVKDPGRKVSEYLAEKNTTVGDFARYGVGEGLEKRQDDFAAEVRAQARAGA